MHNIIVNQGFAPLLGLMLLDRRLAAKRGPVTTLPVVDETTGEGLLTLKQAVALPQLGGVISIKSIRGAITRGDIAASQPTGPGGSLYVTRAAVLKWIDRCPAPLNHHVSISAPPATETAKSARTPLGSSSTPDRSAALAAALKTAAELKRR